MLPQRQSVRCLHQFADQVISEANGHSQEGSRNRSAPVSAPVLRFREFQELSAEILYFSVLLSGVESVHGRAIEFSKRFDEICRAYVCEMKRNVSLTMEIFSFGTPAWPKRSMMWVSTPHVIGLMKPSGGGGVNDELIFSSCDTKEVGSLGIQLPITSARRALSPGPFPWLRRTAWEQTWRRIRRGSNQTNGR